EIVVPLEITNSMEVAALDIPLHFSDGVTLEKVDFDNTRVSYFDGKFANINNEKHTVIIGLFPQLSSVKKDNLAPGTGVIARLVFKVNDPAVTDISIKPIELKNPDHTLTFIHEDKTKMANHEVDYLDNITPDLENISVSLSSVSGEGVPESYALYQNYPNPFNPSTQISFDLPVTSYVNLTIYNVLGQKVITLIDKNMDAGRHEVEWDASNNSSGIYFYRISAENFSQTKKMLMLK
ncbi:MAG: T9SS type A sorting domain-containing protein, partial [FCB group bacterium]|nr:T9SS type A sorting domain-containing protein [FCB group bacterium]